MRGAVIFPLLLTIATLFSVSFALPISEENENTLQINPKNQELPDSSENKYPPFIAQCLIPCDLSQDNPICATDGKNYGSPNGLTCYQMCGHDIQVAYYGKCRKSCTDSSPIEEGSNDVKEMRNF